MCNITGSAVGPRSQLPTTPFSLFRQLRLPVQHHINPGGRGCLRRYRHQERLAVGTDRESLVASGSADLRGQLEEGVGLAGAEHRAWLDIYLHNRTQIRPNE